MSKLLKKIVIVVFCFFAATESVHAMQASVKRWGRREMRIGAAVIAGVCALGLLVRHVMQAYTAVDRRASQGSQWVAIGEFNKSEFSTTTLSYAGLRTIADLKNRYATMLKTAVSADKMYLTGIDLENRGRLLKDEELLAKLKPELRCFSNLTMRIS